MPQAAKSLPIDAEEPVTCADMTDQLRALGVQPGGVLLVHAAFSAVAPVEDGPLGLLWSLLHAVGHEGTLVMPSFADDPDAPFDPAESPCASMGVLADVFWRLPDTLRSQGPRAFAALGPLAEDITAPHAEFPLYGPDSPPGRVLAAGGQVLLLGVGQEANGMLRLAESRPWSAEQAEARLKSAGQLRHGWVGHAQARLMQAADVVALANKFPINNNS